MQHVTKRQKQAKIATQVARAQEARKQYFKNNKQITKKNTRNSGSSRKQRSVGNGRKVISRRGIDIARRLKPRNQLTGYNRSHSSVLALRKTHNRLKSIAKDGVPIVRQWSREGELNIEHGTYESNENHTGTLISGTEFLGTIDVISTAPGVANPTQTGEVLYNLPLSPALMPSTRIKQLQQLFQVYAPKLFAVHFMPIVPATQNGSVIAGITFDPDFSMAVIPPGERGMRVWLSMEGFEMVNVYQPFSVIWCPTIQDGYWSRIVDSDARLTVPGNLVVASASTFSPFDGNEVQLPLFNIMLSYEIEFERRGLQIPQSVQADFQVEISAGVMSDFFFLNGGVSAIGLPVCGNINYIGLSNFTDNSDYIFLCITKASTVTPGITGWTSATGLIDFQTTDQGLMNMDSGRAFYMFLDTGATSACWGFASSLTSALERKTDIFWGEDGLLNTDVLDLTFVIQPIDVS